jgi:hypothetical protein
MRSAYQTQGGGASGEIVCNLADMVHDEATVRHAIRLLQYHCLARGLELRFAHNVPPTPSFARHINHYYVRFCQDAIEAFLQVGFAPYWLRRMENGALIPEILPLGTYGWHVARNTELQPRASGWFTTVPTTRKSAGAAVGGTPDAAATADQAKEKRGGGAHGDLLRYEVNSMYCNERVRVYAFDKPSPMYACGSRLTTVLPAYHFLLQKRECSLRADMFNCAPGLVFKQQEKTRLNEYLNGGTGVLTMGSAEASNKLTGEQEAMGGREATIHNNLAEARDRSNLPTKSVAVVAPMNHDVQSMDRVLSPQDMIREELAFARTVAFALGLPAGMLLQGSSAIASSGGSSASSGNSSSWADCAESNNRQLLDTCRNINRHLELLLCDVYAAIYGGPSGGAAPFFRIACVPTLSIDQLVVGFNARLIDDSAFSAMLETTCGAPLGDHAAAARDELRKAEYVLPFRDRKDTPDSKKTKR